MNTFKQLCLLGLTLSLLIFTAGCSKKDSTNENPGDHAPEVLTTPASEMLPFSALSGGNCSDGGSPVTVKGVCWSTYHDPTTSSQKTEDPAGAGAYASNISGLRPNTTYYVRAYATNSLGTGYGGEVSFTTPGIDAIFSTKPATQITAKTAVSGGNVLNDGGLPITANGVCWSKLPSPTIADSITIDDHNNGSYTSAIKNLVANNTYYVRAYLTNSTGTYYGNELSFVSGSFYIGQSYGGGKIFYIDETGMHGLIAAPSDQGQAFWGCSGSLAGAPDTIVGAGQPNTTIILNGCTESGIAARICSDYILNGYDDWFLPSIGELKHMYWRRVEIDMVNTNSYWSSSEYGSEAARVYSFFYGGTLFEQKTWNLYYVRAVRAF